MSVNAPVNKRKTCGRT